MTAGRIAAVIGAAIGALIGVVLLVAGTSLVWGGSTPLVDVGVDVGADVGPPLATGIGLMLVGVLFIGLAVPVMFLALTADAEPPVQPVATTPAPHPLRLEGRLDPALSRWQWLVKWILAIPHFVVLALLWVAFGILTVVAGFAILFTGRYPRSVFDFNVGVLRWTWRVTYYAVGVLGTDRYPPFSLSPAPGAAAYPAELDVAHPPRLSRGLVLVKWWLLAIPHYLIVAVLTGGAASWTYTVGGSDGAEVATGGGLIGLLVFIAAVILLFTGRYPRSLYDLIMGLQCWVYRVLVYAALMTDVYPPFRLDAGGSEPPAPAPPEPAGPAGGATAERQEPATA